MVRVQDVIGNRVAGAAVLDIEGPAAVGGHHHRGIHYHVILGTGGAVNPVERDAAGVVVIQQVVLDAGANEPAASGDCCKLPNS